jgi:hypothetical protein
MSVNILKYLIIPLLLVLAHIGNATSFDTRILQSDKGSIQTLSYSDTVKDYGPVISSILQRMMQTGGGTLKINYGKYPVHSTITVDNRGNLPKLSIIGVKNKAGKYPLFYDEDSSKNPHHFFSFTGNAVAPSMNIHMSNLEIVGNNIPYSKSHPFYNKVPGMNAIVILNSYTATIENVIIRNFYGRGILMANYYDPKYNRKYRAEAPVIRNCKILNVWSWSSKMDSGDGIEFFSVNKPIVENNVIINELKNTKHIGRGGVVLEHNTEKSKIRNNRIAGYRSGIHAECDWGGHLIEKNTFTQSSIAVTLSEDCNQPDSLLKEFSPIVIRNNNMSYNQEQLKYKIPVGNFSFISVHRPNPMLNGLTVVDNTMTYSFDPTLKEKETNAKILKKDKSIYIELKGQPKTVVKGNRFK